MKRQTKETSTPNDQPEPILTVSDARRDLTTLVMGFETSPSRVVKVTRLKKPTALIVSESRYGAIIAGMRSGDLMPILVRLVANKWLGSNEIPPHLYQLQIDEFSTMTQAQLLALYHADLSAPMDTLMEESGIDEVLIDRLIKRCKICQAIAEAEKDELYEVAEHLSDSSDC